MKCAMNHIYVLVYDTQGEVQHKQYLKNDPQQA